MRLLEAEEKRKSVGGRKKEIRELSKHKNRFERPRKCPNRVKLVEEIRQINSAER